MPGGVPRPSGVQLRPGLPQPGEPPEARRDLRREALPKKGRLSASEKAREAEPAFSAARRKHSGVESAINNLEHRGLDRVRLRGPDGFELAVGLSVLSLNIHRLGMILRDKERKRLERQRKKMREERKRLERQRERTQRERGPPHRCQRLRAA